MKNPNNKTALKRRSNGSLNEAPSVEKSAEKFPSQIKYIVWNEACERYSYYGMRSILVIFLVQYLLIQEADAVSNYHLFSAACYLFPLLGAYISDRFWGKYKTILILSLVYCLGHAFLAVFEHSKLGFYCGLGLIAFGSGGIKPCVSAHVGDQFKPSQKNALKKVFDVFYWMINFGSFFSTLITPLVLKKYGPGWAFGIPGILMFIATVIFWMGRKQFVHVPPTGKSLHGTGRVLFSALKNIGKQKGFLEGAKADHPEQSVDDVKAAFNVGKIFLAITVFWALFDQHGSSWVLQAKEMDLSFGHFGIENLLPSQIPALNPIMVMVLIPIFTFGIYPFIERFLKYEMTSLRRMGWGMFIAAISFVFVGIFQYVMDGGNQISVLWQGIPFLVITMAEVMISITGLSFAYTQAPRSMKSTIMSMWLLTVFFGNMITAWIARINVFKGGSYFLFFAALMLLFTGIFALIARKYKVQDFMEDIPINPQDELND